MGEENKMRKMFLAILSVPIFLSLCLVSLVSSKEGVKYKTRFFTKEGCFVCGTAFWVDDFSKLLKAEDKASIKAYLDSNKCFFVKKGIEVTQIGGSSWATEIMLNGVRLLCPT
jgi:hypothetical protein